MNEPLAQRMRPKTLAEVCGQQHLLAPGRVFRRTIESGRMTKDLVALYEGEATGLNSDAFLDAIAQTMETL